MTPDLIPTELLALLLCLGLAVLGLRWRAKRLSRRDKRARRWLIVDGSNVLYWQDNTPQLRTIIKVVREVEARGYDPLVIFDANAGYLVKNRYLHDQEFADLLSLPDKAVLVVPKGTPADLYVLRAARDAGARVLTNDRFRDWADDYPEVRRKGHLVKGRMISGHLDLKL